MNIVKQNVGELSWLEWQGWESGADSTFTPAVIVQTQLEVIIAATFVDVTRS